MTKEIKIQFLESCVVLEDSAGSIGILSEHPRNNVSAGTKVSFEVSDEGVLSVGYDQNGCMIAGTFQNIEELEKGIEKGWIQRIG